MLKLSKKTEYALMAVRYLAIHSNGRQITAKEISGKVDIPYELLAKVLQTLNKKRIVQSVQGIKGGYTLMRDPSLIPLIEIIKAIEPNYQITDCLKDNGSKKDCARIDCCTIRNPLSKVQNEIDKVFKETTIKQII